MSFRSIAGHLALIELEEMHRDDSDRIAPLTGIIATGSSGDVTVIALSSSDLVDGSKVVVSVFAPEALYRIRAAARWGLPGTLLIAPVHGVERIERRSRPRHALHLNVTLVAHDGPGHDLEGVAGRTLDLGVAGLRVETISPLPPCPDVTALITLPDGSCLVIRTTVVSVQFGDSSFEYRLAFDPLGDVDTKLLSALVGRQSASAGVA